MSVHDESAARRRAAENDPDLNPDGTVGVGTDGSLTSHIDRHAQPPVGVGTDGSLTTDPDEPQEPTTPDPHDEPR